MARNDDRRIIQLATNKASQINEVFRQLCSMIYTLEGRSGRIPLRDSVDIVADSPSILRAIGTNATLQIVEDGFDLAIARGAESDGEGWIATETQSSILEFKHMSPTDFTSDLPQINIYLNSGLLVGQNFIPTLRYTFGLTGLSGLALPVLGIQGSDQIVNNSTTFVDSSLTFPVEASSTYVFEFNVGWQSNATADIKYTVTAPAGATGGFGYVGVSNVGQSTSSATAFGTTLDELAADALAHLTLFKGTVVTDTTAGSVTFQFAQRVSTAVDTTIFANSSFKVNKVS